MLLIPYLRKKSLSMTYRELELRGLTREDPPTPHIPPSHKKEVFICFLTALIFDGSLLVLFATAELKGINYFHGVIKV